MRSKFIGKLCRIRCVRKAFYKSILRKYFVSIYVVVCGLNRVGKAFTRGTDRRRVRPGARRSSVYTYVGGLSEAKIDPQVHVLVRKVPTPHVTTDKIESSFLQIISQ